MIYLELFCAFFFVGLFSVGGGYAAIPLIEEQMVYTHAFISEGEFANLVSIAEMTPGPIAVNAATFIGMKITGVLGGLVATLGVIAPSLIVVSIIYMLYRKYRNLVILETIMTSLRAVVVALIASAGLSLLKTALWSEGQMSILSMDYVQLIIFALALCVLRIKKVNPIVVMLLCGAFGGVLAVLT